MNSLTIKRLLKNYKCFKGVYPSDRLPYNLPLPLNIIVNTDPHYKPGQHWVCVSIDEFGNGYYFDSFGLPPLVDDIFNFIAQRAYKGWRYNRNIIQNISSTTCGKYCIIFIINACNNLTPEFFIRNFGEDTFQNDIKISRILENFSLINHL